MSESIETLLNGHVTEAMMIIAALVAILIIYTYRKDDESGSYKLSAALGVIVGVFLIVAFVGRTANWNTIDKVIVLLLAFALIIRPFRDLNLAFVVALIIGIAVYVFLGDVGIGAINSGWGRIILAFVIMIFIYGLLHFVQSLIELVGKIINWTPLLAILAVLCLADGALMLAGHESIGLMIH